MTGITLEQRARELLESTGASISTPDEVSSWMEVVRLDDVLTTIEAALRLSAGADWVLVPREPTSAMEIALSDALAAGDFSLSECLRRANAAAPDRGGEVT